MSSFTSRDCLRSWRRTRWKVCRTGKTVWSSRIALTWCSTSIRPWTVCRRLKTPRVELHLEPPRRESDPLTAARLLVMASESVTCSATSTLLAKSENPLHAPSRFSFNVSSILGSNRLSKPIKDFSLAARLTLTLNFCVTKTTPRSCDHMSKTQLSISIQHCATEKPSSLKAPTLPCWTSTSERIRMWRAAIAPSAAC